MPNGQKLLVRRKRNVLRVLLYYNSFHFSADECKQRWKNLRGSLTRNLSQRLKSSYGNKQPKTFYLTKYMQFVMPFAKSR